MRKTLIVSGITILVSIALFMLVRKPLSIEHSGSRPSHPSERVTSISKSSSDVAKSPVTAVTSSSPTPSSLDAEWLHEHYAGINVRQSAVEGEFNRGTIRVGSVQGDLGESPPRYLHQLKADKGHILLGEEDDRHSFRRYISTVREEKGALVHTIQVSISWTKSAPKISLGGFIFRRDEADIKHVGLIIPEIEVPAGDDPARLLWEAYIRLGNQEIGADDLAGAVSQPLGPDTVLLMPTKTTPPPTTARVLWLALDANGSFSVAHNR